ncbi:hypothetical protein [Kitasatospora sp. NPDC051705]|uniref:hypothetical protein n=1 Tax=Kitasatospora sp. NPDC051705 TaxID=3364057 RepID=UPI00379CF3DA
MTYQPYHAAARATATAPATTAAQAATATQGPPGHAFSEATRLLSAGVYLDPELRRRVVSELVEHEERSVPPSLGFDLVTVLAHALRARALEFRTGAVLAAVWAGFFVTAYLPLLTHPPSSGYGSSRPYRVVGDSSAGNTFDDLTRYATPYLANTALLYALACLLSWYAKSPDVREDALYAPAAPAVARPAARRPANGLLSLAAGVAHALYWVVALLALRDSHLLGVLFPLALAATVWVHRLLVAGTVRRELNREDFLRLRPRQLPAGPRYARIGAAIGAEQYSPLVVYDPADPFLGAGTPYQPWSFVLELKRRRTGSASATPDPATAAPAPTAAAAASPAGELTARAVLDLIVPRLLALRQAAASTSLDRLRDMEVQELVFLPYGPRRADVPRDQETVARHLAAAVDEGAERRRHFLRVRVGAWDEQVVLSVLLRVHTQGRLLVVEVVPHVLGPVRRDYELLADAAALRGTRLNGGRPAVSAFTAGPAALRALRHPGGAAGGDGEAVVAARPVVSVRELAAEPTVSLFQELDVNRYVKTIEERIIDGVREALHSEGYETGRFEQTVVQVLDGGIHIGSMSGGAVASGPGATARHSPTPEAPHGEKTA